VEGFCFVTPFPNSNFPISICISRLSQGKFSGDTLGHTEAGPPVGFAKGGSVFGGGQPSIR